MAKSTSGYVILEGNIGVGKTTFSWLLAEEIKAMGCRAEVLLEPDESTNPFLECYYKDPKANAYKMQMHLLHQRFRATQYAQTAAMDGRGWYILDRSYFGDICFAKVQVKDGYFDEHEYKSYLDAHRNMRRFIEMPTAAIFLDASPEVCANRMRKRARSCESGVPIGYLRALDVEIHALYRVLKPRCNTLRLDWNDDEDEESLRAYAHALAGRLLDGGRSDWDF